MTINPNVIGSFNAYQGFQVVKPNPPRAPNSTDTSYDIPTFWFYIDPINGIYNLYYLGSSVLLSGGVKNATWILISGGGGGQLTWSDQSSSFTAVVNNGYFCTAALTVTLPSSPSQSDTVVIAVDTASTVIIQAPTGTLMRIGNRLSSSGGTFTNSSIGDSVEFVYRVADTTWFSIASTGSWNPA